MTIFITQSNYIPWKGYFDAINSADVFVVYDDMQYTKNDWRNRNQIKTPNGTQWLTIPVKSVSLDQKINETAVANQVWRKKHWKTIVQNYSKAPHFKKYAAEFEALYLDSSHEKLSEINHSFIVLINKLLCIETEVVWSSDYELKGDKNERLVNLCTELGGTKYLSGPAAQNYLAVDLFTKAGIEVEWMDYSNYPEYPQLFPPFEHGVTVLDLLFNMGQEARTFMKSFDK